MSCFGVFVLLLVDLFYELPIVGKFQSVLFHDEFEVGQQFFFGLCGECYAFRDCDVLVHEFFLYGFADACLVYEEFLELHAFVGVYCFAYYAAVWGI